MQAPVGKTTALPLRLPPIRTSPGSVAVKLSSAALLHTGVEGAAAIAPRGHTVSLLQSGTGSRVQRRSGFRPRPGRAGRLETEGPRPSSRGHRGRNQDSDAPRLQTPDGPAACVLAGPSTTFQRAECNVRDEVAASLRPAGHRRSLRRSQQRRFCRRGAGWGQARDGGAGGGMGVCRRDPPSGPSGAGWGKPSQLRSGVRFPPHLHQLTRERRRDSDRVPARIKDRA